MILLFSAINTLKQEAEFIFKKPKPTFLNIFSSKNTHFHNGLEYL